MQKRSRFLDLEMWKKKKTREPVFGPKRGQLQAEVPSPTIVAKVNFSSGPSTTTG